MIRNTIKYRHRVFIRSVACLRHQQLVFTLERKSHNHHRVTYSHLHYNSFCSEYSKFTHDRRAVLDGAQRGGYRTAASSHRPRYISLVIMVGVPTQFFSSSFTRSMAAR
jgi:hypothetical protein